MRWVALVALATLVCAARFARADNGGVGVVAYGDPVLQPTVANRFERWLRKHGHQVNDTPMSVDAIKTLSNCFTIDDLVCARGVFDARAKTDSLVYVGVDVNGKNVTFNVYWFVKGKDAVGERRVCEKCDDNEWHALTDTMLERLTADVKVPPPPGKRPSRLGPTLVLGGGIAFIAAGGISLYYGSLGDPGDKWIYPNATPVGIALATVGAGAVIGGAIWLVQSGSPRSGPVATATRDGAYVGWVGHF